MRPRYRLLSTLACAVAVLATVAGAEMGAESGRENHSPGVQGADSANSAALLLLDAVERNDVDAVAALLARGVDVGARARFRGACCLSALELAALGNRLDITALLIEFGADVDAMNVNGCTPLHFAAHGGAEEVARALLAAGATADPPSGGSTASPLLMAVRGKKEKLALLLIERGADVGVGGDSGAALLALAEANGLYEVAVRILVRGDSLQVDDPSAMLPAAVAADAVAVVARLLEAGGDINVKVNDWWDGWTGWDDEASLLHVAARRDSVSVARLLLDRGLDPDVPDGEGATPLHRAAWFGHHETGEVLLDRGASVDARNEYELTPLHDAVHRMEPATAALLLERGADVNARGPADWTPLHFALLGVGGVTHADVVEVEFTRKLVRMLIEHGADVNASTALAARTPLHLAVLVEDPEILATLIESGADVNAQTRLGGATPLHLALNGNGCRADDICAALRAAGGEDRAGGDAGPVPMMSWGPAFEAGYGVPNSNADLHTGRASSLYSRPTPAMFMDDTASAMQGSFSAAGVNERLVVEPVSCRGSCSYLEEFAFLTGLIDSDGQTRLLWVSDSHTRLLTRCRDAETGTDHAVFSRRSGGNVAPDIVYMAYDAARETLVEVFVDRKYGEHFWNKMREREKRGVDSFACPWRDKHRYREAFRALEAGTWAREDTIDVDEEQMVLPTRILSSEVVESSLATLRSLSVSVDVVADSHRWRILVVEPDHSGHVGGPGGVVLVHDKERERWRSIYDCHHMKVLDQRVDSLFAVLEEDCTYRDPGSGSIYEIDLSTSKTRRRGEHGPS